jgi:competence protein ComFA
MNVQGLTLPHPLTPAQAAASHTLAEWVEKRAGRQFLVWAACGAGKTEVSFEAIDVALRRGARVMFAAPRRDVVIELQPRISGAFRGRAVAAFYGGAPPGDARADVVLLTTHQAVRFHHRFDLAVLDEADAYPYFGSEILTRAVERAVKPGGQMVLMTATPPPEYVARVRSGDLPCVRISARHHGHPLPVPCVVQVRGIDLPEQVASLISPSLRSGGRVIVFVPRRDQAPDLAAALRRAIPGSRVEWVHAQDPDRGRKLSLLVTGECDVLVATSVMERGVTVDGVDVVVTEADSSGVFDSRALIQMAGRAGRTRAHPTGKVWFICQAVNSEIGAAVQQIREMNEDARSRGLLDGSTK